MQEISGLPFPRLLRDDEGFLFPPDMPPHSYTTWKRSEVRAGRAVEEISPREIGNAMSDVAGVGLGLSSDDLIRLTAQAFGIGRVTVGIRARLEAALERALADGHLCSGAFIVAP